MLNVFQVHTLAWKDIASLAQQIVPPLLSSSHKGSMGRLAVIGGSKDYTGAPFYAAQAGLKFGADLSFVFCSQQASVPIKCYSPELMVTPFYDDNHCRGLAQLKISNYIKYIEEVVLAV